MRWRMIVRRIAFDGASNLGIWRMELVRGMCTCKVEGRHHTVCDGLGL